jgi:glutaredoxin
MKSIIGAFFKTLRVILGPFMLLWEIITRPKGIARDTQAQADIDQQCKSLALFQYKTCPFCIKVRQEMHRLSLNIELIDAQQEGKNREALVSGGGRAKVPCLRITDKVGKNQWMYESGEIMTYLRRRFESTEA